MKVKKTPTQSKGPATKRCEGAFRALTARLFPASILLLVCAAVAQAVPLSIYQQRVQHAVLSIGMIGTSLENEARNQKREEEKEAEVLAELRALLAADETVEWAGGTLRVDNSWLKELLDVYAQLPAGDSKRMEVLARIAERLQSIDDRLTEVMRASGKTVNKDEEKARLASILRREEYSRQTTEGNALSRLVKRIRDWLRRLFPKRDETAPQRESHAVNNTAQIGVSLLALAVILYVAWRFLPRFMRREMRKRKPKERGARVVLGERLEADEGAADLLAEAETLARAGDLRGAIRKGYIALLCELHDRKLLRLEQHKTNRDYLRAVEANRPLYEEMKPMTTSFESHWYGVTPATETDWQAFRSRYKKAVER